MFTFCFRKYTSLQISNSLLQSFERQNKVQSELIKPHPQLQTSLIETPSLSLIPIHNATSCQVTINYEQQNRIRRLQLSEFDVENAEMLSNVTQEQISLLQNEVENLKVQISKQMIFTSKELDWNSSMKNNVNGMRKQLLGLVSTDVSNEEKELQYIETQRKWKSQQEYQNQMIQEQKETIQNLQKDIENVECQINAAKQIQSSTERNVQELIKSLNYRDKSDSLKDQIKTICYRIVMKLRGIE